MSFTGGKLKLKGDDTGVKKKKKKKSKAEDDSKALQLIEETDAQESMPKVNTAYHQLIPGNLVTSTCPPNRECATGLSQHLVSGTLLGTHRASSAVCTCANVRACACRRRERGTSWRVTQILRTGELLLRSAMTRRWQSARGSA